MSTYGFLSIITLLTSLTLIGVILLVDLLYESTIKKIKERKGGRNGSNSD